MNDVGNSVLSEAVTYVAAAVPGAPGQPSMTSTSETEIGITWSSADENGSLVTRYDIYASMNDEDNFELIGNAASTSYTATGLIIGNNYKFKVLAVNYAGEGPLSVESDFIIAATVPDPPVNLVRLYADNSFMTVGWDTPTYNGGSPVFGFKIYYDMGMIAEGTGLTFFHIATAEHDALMYTKRSDIVEGSTYAWRIVAYNAIGESEPSQVLSVIAANFPESPLAPTMVS